jgi:hypothetical protein
VLCYARPDSSQRLLANAEDDKSAACTCAMRQRTLPSIVGPRRRRNAHVMPREDVVVVQLEILVRRRMRRPS